MFPEIHIASLQGRTARAPKLAALEARRELYRRAMAGATDDFLASPGPDGFLAFQTEMQREVKDLFISAYIAGRGGSWREAGPAEWGRLGAVLKRQYRFIRGFASDLATREPPLTRAQILARTDLYAAAASESFERGVAAQVGLNASVLPAQPGDGTTLCRSRCRCHWSIQILSKARGDFNCSWRLGSAEHCETCRSRARSHERGGWQRLRVRGGVLIDTPAPLFAD